MSYYPVEKKSDFVKAEDIFLSNVYKRPISTWKEAQGHKVPENASQYHTTLLETDPEKGDTRPNARTVRSRERGWAELEMTDQQRETEPLTTESRGRRWEAARLIVCQRSVQLNNFKFEKSFPYRKARILIEYILTVVGTHEATTPNPKLWETPITPRKPPGAPRQPPPPPARPPSVDRVTIVGCTCA